MTRTLIFDTEVYSNYFLLMFRNTDSGKITCFEKYNDCDVDLDTIRKILVSYRIIGFNSINFDIPLIFLLLKNGTTNATLKACCDNIILKGLKPWHLEEKFGYRIHNRINHIDLIEVAPGKASLKVYGGRLHSQKMQDLPISPDEIITDEMRKQLVEYCGNDLRTTEDLYRKLTPQLDLRENMGKECGIDLRSKSDAQIAETVIKSQLEKSTGKKIRRTEEPGGQRFKYHKPGFVSFKTAGMKKEAGRLISAEYVTTDGGKILMPEFATKEEFSFGESRYKLGMGGLHSCEASICHESDKERAIRDFDVKSYYPAIILNCKLYPKHLGKEFLDLYRFIVQRRLDAKSRNDSVTADSLKITVNGTFGKLGSKWSFLYSPDLLIQTTVTGQLSLLMLIEMLELDGARVISANTDGVVVSHKRSDEKRVNSIISAWELITGFETEETRYRGIYSRDVNSYIAIKENGGVKLKGAYTPAGLQKNPTNEICTDAVITYLKHGTPVEETIRGCANIKKFVTIRSVKGGAVKNDMYLGRAVRWYYAKGEKGTIRYKINGYTVARTEGAKPLMELPEKLPDDIDYEWYVSEAKSILTDIGVL